MPEILDTVTEYENKALEFVTNAQAPVVEYVGKAAEAVAARLPENRPTLPFDLVAVIDSQFGFAVKAIKTQQDFTKAVVKAAGPLLGVAAKPAKRTVKAA